MDDLETSGHIQSSLKTDNINHLAMSQTFTSRATGAAALTLANTQAPGQVHSFF
jgi:hypothetical protein